MSTECRPLISTFVVPLETACLHPLIAAIEPADSTPECGSYVAAISPAEPTAEPPAHTSAVLATFIPAHTAAIASTQ